MIKYHVALLIIVGCCFVAHAENGKPIKKNYLPVPQEMSIEDTVVKPEISITTAITNTYYWRGMTFNKGVIFQPSITLSQGNWFSNVWSNVVANETGGNKIIPEVDFSAGYVIEKENWSITPQANFFLYPSRTEGATVEFGTEFQYDLENIGLYINPNFDIGSNLGGIYIDYGLCKSGDINARLSYDAKFLLGWGNKSFYNFYKSPAVVETIAMPLNIKEESMKSMRLQLGAGYQASKHLTFQPQLIAFRNFMTEYTFQHTLFQFNGSLTCTYVF